MKVLILDTETSGTNPLEDRLITAYVGLVDFDQEPLVPIIEQSYVALPEYDFEMPAGAAAVNGYTTDRLHAEAQLSTSAVVTQLLRIIAAERVPIVAYNAAFDMSLLWHEARRAGLDTAPLDEALVLDPYVAWKKLEPYRKGGRKLVDAAHAFHIHVGDADYHDARFDALLAGRVMQKIMRREPYAALPLQIVHEETALDYRDQAISFQQWKRRTDPSFIANKQWPIQEVAV